MRNGRIGFSGSFVRTTPGLKPQEGISFILIDMKTPAFPFDQS